MPKIPDTNITIKATDKASKTFKQVYGEVSGLTKKGKAATKQLEKMQESLNFVNRRNSALKKSFKSSAKSLAIFGAVGAVIGTTLVAPTIKLQKTMSELKAVTSASASEMKTLEQQAKDLGGTTRYTASEVGELQVNLGRAGFKSEAIKEMTASVLNFATATKIDLATASLIATKSLGGFGLKAKDTTKLVDQLAQTTRITNTTIDGVAETLKMVAPISKTAGQNVSDVLAAIGALGNAGLDGTISGTGLKTFLTNLAAPTSAARDRLKELGIEVTDSNGKIRSIIDISSDFAKELEKIPNQSKKIAIMKDVFGKIGITSASNLIKAVGSMKKFSKQINESNGTTKEMAKIMNDNLDGAIKNLASSFEAFTNAIMDTNKDGLQGIIESITSSIRSTTKFIKNNEWLISTIKTLLQAYIDYKVIALASTGIQIGLNSALAIYKTIQIQTATTTGILTASTKAFGIALRANPIGVVITALQGLVTVGVLVYQNWDIVKSAIESVWEVLKFTGVAVAEFLHTWTPLGGLYDLLRLLIDLLGVAYDKLDSMFNLTDKFKDIGSSISNFFSSDDESGIVAKKQIEIKERDKKRKDEFLSRNKIDVNFSPTGAKINSMDSTGDSSINLKQEPNIYSGVVGS